MARLSSLALAALALAACAAGPALEIRDALSGGVYGRWPLAENGEFAVEFVHSVNQSPVRESFRVKQGTIWPAAARFTSFGAGMQSDLEEGQTLSRDGEALVLSGPNRPFRELNYIVGTVSDHVLYINGETLSLRELCGRNAHITFGVNP
ncbi:MAG: DUF1850 domain-containing protein [Treponema sp.]|nr:DUF1850 domain-containing protein [Treponema sp.]